MICLVRNGRWTGKWQLNGKQNLQGLTAGQCELPVMGDGKVKCRWTGKQNLKGITAGQCELPVMEDGKENDNGTENKIYKGNGRFRTSFG